MMKTTSTNEVVLGVTGSIAAYKACEIASLLVKQGVRVTPVLTRSARELVAPASFEAITGNRAITEMFEPLLNPEIEHIAVATRARLFLIAPATANVLAKAAHGIADDWLSTTLLATRAPILFAPAMNTNMYEHPATQANMAILRERGCRFVGPDVGRMACGTEGIGRMIKPETVVDTALTLLDPRCDLDGRHVLITSGGTHEPIDPVRYIGNRSSGKMGRALAREALSRKARVTVVTGPHDASLPHGVDVHVVETAAQMAEIAARLAPEADAIIGAAAVSDFRPQDSLTHKHKRGAGALTLTLVENPDIIATIGMHKRPGQVVVAFAAETDDLIENAKVKLDTKHADLVVANQVGTPDSGFGSETLTGCILDRNDGADPFEGLSKADLAERLIDRITALLGTFVPSA